MCLSRACLFASVLHIRNVETAIAAGLAVTHLHNRDSSMTLRALTVIASPSDDRRASRGHEA